jgi:hydroxyacylglutathione hydrolase
MIFKHFLTRSNEGNAFIAACEKTQEAILVDVGAFEEEIADFIEARGLRLTKVFITHDHYDHTDGLRDVMRRYDVEVFGGKGMISGCPATAVNQGDTVAVGELTATVLETTGHTPDGRSLSFPGAVFSGDALFAGSVGGTTSPGQGRQQLDLIRSRIFSLPPATEIHTGHGPSSTVAVESQYNPFFV